MESTSTKKVVFNSVIYSASGLMLKCFGFFLLPLYTAYLTTTDYGINSIASSFTSTMCFVVAFSLYSAVLRFYVDLKDDPEQLKRFYGTVSLFVFLSGVFFFVLMTVFRGALTRYVFQGIDYYPIVFACLIALIFHCEQLVFDKVLKSQQRAVKSSILSIAFFFTTLAFNILFVVILKKGALGTIMASGISYFCYTAYFVIDLLVKKQIHFCFDWPLLKRALKYSLPIMPHNLSTQIALLVSKVLIGDVVSLSGLGVYTVASQFGNMADTVQVYVDNAYGPWLYEKLHQKETDYKQSIRNISKMLSAVIGFFFLGLSLFAHDYIVLFINKSYVDAWKYVPMIVLVFAMKTSYYFYVEVLFYYKKASRYLFTATLTSSLVNILFSYFLIPLYGIVGSIFADGISMLIRIAIIVFISKKFDDIGLRLGDFILNYLMVSLFIAAGLALSVIKYQSSFSIINLFYKCFICVAYLGLVALMNKRQIRPLINYIRNKLKK